MKPSSSLFGLLLGLFASASAIGCAADEGDAHPAELVSPAEADMALALVRDQQDPSAPIYVVRATRLDRIDPKTGAVSEVAGAEWAECPRDPSIRWLSMALDRAAPNLVVRGTKLFFVQEQCGVWSFDVATKAKHMLVDPSIETKKKRMKEEGVFPMGATWNGKTGPDWGNVWGMAFAADGDGLIGCFQAFADETDAMNPGAAGYRRRIELWSMSTTGVPLDRLTFVNRERAPKDGENYCEHVIPDPTSILFSTDHSILRFDRQTRSLTPVVSGFRHGTRGLAQDASHVFYVGEQNDIRKIARGGSEPLVLRASTSDPLEPTRMTVTLDGEHVYFHEGYSLARVKKDGTDLAAIATGTQADWVLPMTLGIADQHVYFERITVAHKETRNDNGSVSFARTYMGAMYRAPK